MISESTPPDGPFEATASTELERQIMNSNVPKNEREWWASREIENLRRWKKEQLTVTAWWQAIDDFIRKSPEAPIGEHVSAIALKWLQERREVLDTAEALYRVLGIWRTDLASIPDHLPFGGDSRAKIAAILSQIDELLPPSP